MGRLSRWAVRRPLWAIAVWVLMAAMIGGIAAMWGGTYNDSFELPDTESTAAQELLATVPGVSDGLSTATAKVVWGGEAGDATDPGVQAQVNDLLTEIAAIPSVACIVTPYGQPLGDQCPQTAGEGAPDAATGADSGAAAQPPAGTAAELPAETAAVLAGLGASGISVDGSVGYATVAFGTAPQDLPLADARAVLDAVEAANGVNGLAVGASGQALEMASAEPPSSEGIGVTVALVILMFAFGSVVGAVLPVGLALLSLGVGQALVLVTANFLDVATFAPTLAAMIGLGVGIDYALFVVNRFKQALDAGSEPKAAALESVRTAGRSVLFAAITVIIALGGLFVIGINFFNGLAVAAAATVLMMMIGATFLLPAVLSLLGRRVFALRLPWARKAPKHDPHGSGFARYGAWLQRNFRWVGAGALIALLVVAIPMTAMRLGFTDDGGRVAGSPQRIAYDLTAEAFGPGVNGPFVVAVQTPTPGDDEAVNQLVGALSADPGVAAALALPMSDDATVTAIQVVPTTSPQDEATAELLDRMRTDIIPPVEQSTGITAHVGGTQAITTDFTEVLTDALPLFLLVVLGFGFLVLVVLFRSILVPLTGVVTSLLSLGAAVGVTVAVFQWGWFADLVGVSSTGPIMPFLPIMVFAILFGLSMDYQVFLVSRMQEEWLHTGDNVKAVRRGLAGSGRVVGLAAAIMVSVFGAFVLGNDSTIKLFGLSLATAVLFDAFIVRLVIVPSVMYQLGRANWWLPGWLDRILPNVSVESADELAIEAGEIDDIPDPEVPVSPRSGVPS